MPQRPWFMSWMTGGDTSIHIEIGAYWKLSALIITAEQFMAPNCVFTVHRALPHPSWRDSPSGLWKWKKPGWVDTLERRDFKRLRCARAFHHVMQLPWQKCNFTSSTTVLLQAENQSDWILLFGGSAVQALCLLNAVVQLFVSPQESTLALMSLVSRNKGDNYFGASCAEKHGQRAHVAHCARIKP